MKKETESNHLVKAPLHSDWIRVSDACDFAKVSKPTLYGWMTKGWVKNSSLRGPGQIKGVRLVSFASLKAFIESAATGGASSIEATAKS